MLATTPRIAIIGSGISGRLVAFNLQRHAQSRLHIRMIDRRTADYMGPAYSVNADYLLLNVPAGRMGAPADDPQHFWKWARDRGIAAGEWDFLSRKLYRDYMLDLHRAAVAESNDRVDFEQIQGEVVDLEVHADLATLRTRSGDSFVADKVVLAFGNFPPRHPPIPNRAALNSRRYIQNPWDLSSLDSISSTDPVLLIGTGQTTVDLLVALHHRQHQGRIVAIARHGVLPLAHRGFENYPSFFAETENAKSIAPIVRAVRRQLERAESTSVDLRAVIDSMRPDTQTLWLGLPSAEKRRFLRHVLRHWEIIRSRIPPHSDEIVRAMRESGQLEIVAGRIRDFEETETSLNVHYTPRRGTSIKVESAALVLNTIGPESDYTKIDDALVNSLMARGLVRPGPASVGIDALPDGTVLGRTGAVSQVLYTLGTPMKGVLWEVVAVAEIRAQAAHLATILLNDEPRPFNPPPLTTESVSTQ